MEEDSTFAETLKIFARIRLTTWQTTKRITAEMIKSKPEKERTPVKPNTTDMSARAVSPYNTSRYMVMELRNLSIIFIKPTLKGTQTRYSISYQGTVEEANKLPYVQNAKAL